MPALTVARSLAADIVGYLDTLGLRGTEVAHAAGIDLEAPGERVTGAQMAALWHHAVRVTNDPDLGLHTATRSSAGALDIVGYVMLSSRTAAEALRRGARLMRLLNDGVDLHLDDRADVTVATLVTLSSRSDPLWAQSRQVSETILAGLVHQLRQLTGRHVVPRAVRFTHAAPAHGVREHERVFGITPAFGAADCAVELHAADLRVALRSANAALLTAFSAHADAALEALGQRETVTARVATEIVARLRGEAPDVATVASALAMSARTLQRALAAEGTTYQRVLDAVRREVAVRYLAEPGATMAKAAWLVGFSEASAFYRAWRRWGVGGSGE